MANLVPPFSAESAHQKVKKAQALWNTKDPSKCVQAYTVDSIWRNRDRFFQGHQAIEKFLTEKWVREKKCEPSQSSSKTTQPIDPTGQSLTLTFAISLTSLAISDRLKKELFAFTDNKIAVQFWYEYELSEGDWRRCYGLEDWTFDQEGKMKKRQMSGNEISISESERWFKDGMSEEEIDSLVLGDAHH